jgi:polysaccharide biosynthesis protein PslG
MMCRLLVAVALVASVLVPGSARAATPSDSGLAIGFTEGSGILDDSDRALERRMEGMAETGAEWVRIDVRWPDVERRRGVYRWRSVDRLVDAAREHGLSVLGILDFTPRWARPKGTTEKHPPKSPRTFAGFAAAAALHFRGEITAFEVWNEPNSPYFWEEEADADAYAALLEAAYDEIKKVDPTVTVITGGTSPGETGDGYLSPVDFLDRLYEIDAGRHFDAVAHHAYNWPYLPSQKTDDPNHNAFGGVVPLLRKVMVRHDDADTKIWITETGAPVPAERDGVKTTKQYLTRTVKDTFRLVTSKKWSDWIGGLFWYSYRDAGKDRSSFGSMFGLVRRDFDPKGTALDAFASEIGRIEARG